MALIAALLGSPALASTSLEVGVLGSTETSGAGDAIELGLRFGPALPSTSGAELGLSFFSGLPDAGSDAALGWVGVVLDLDLAHAAALGEGTSLASRVGTTLQASAAEGGGGLAGGFNAGVGIARVPARGVGVRADLGYRLIFSSGAQGIAILSVGLVWPGKEGP
jgi:hypothetical protein